MSPEARVQNQACEVIALAAEAERAIKALSAAAYRLNIVTQQTNRAA